MKKVLLLTILLLSCNSASVWADGEERNEAGTRWVDPVEFYELQDIDYTDLTRDYDQGDIDFNRVLKKKGVTVYGLRLKPIAVAAHIQGEKPIGEDIDWIETQAYEYSEVAGIKGAPINESSFCVYADEGVSRTFTGIYNLTKNIHFTTNRVYYINGERHVLEDDNWKNEVKLEIQIQDLRIVPTEDGIGLSYALKAKEQERTIYNLDDGKAVDDHFTGSWDCHKAAGVSPVLGHFIYYQGSRNLLVILSADLMDVYNEAKPSLGKGYKLPDSHQMSMLKRPWPRIYFIVEEILIADGGGTPLLDEQTRIELNNTMQGLLTWLSGEGDPFGFGEHTDAKTSAVLNTVSTIASILLTNGLVSIVGGGSGSGLVGALTNSITGAGNAPPTTPDTPKVDAMEPKRKEDEEDEQDKTPPPPPDPNKFNPSDYPYGNQFLHQQADGDVVMKSPVTGKDVHYYSNGDGTWTSDTGITYSSDDIAERLRFEAENAGVLKQDADQAAKNAAEQRAQWEAQNQRDLERGYSDEMKDFRDWQAEQEAAEKKQLELERLAQKYHVPPTEKAIKDAIKFEQTMNQIDYQTHMAESEAYDKTISYLETVDKVAEVSVNVMGSCVPGGEAVKNAYTFAKSTLVATSEAIADGKSFGEGMAHIAVGMGNGALGVIQNEAGNLTKDAPYGLLKEYGITIGTETAKEGFTKFYETGDIGKAMGAVANAAGKKTLEFGVGKMINVGFETMKGGAADYVDYAKNGLVPDNDWAFKGACKMNNLLNKTANFNIGPEVKGIGGSVTTAIAGTVEKGALVESIVNEAVGATDLYDTAGTISEETLDFFKEIGKFSEKAAQFRKR